MTLLEHVYALKNILSRGAASDDFRLTNRLLAHYLQIARAKLLEQKIDKYRFISEQSYQDWCADFELSSFHNCCDVPELDCKVLRSVLPVPKFLNSRWGNHLKVMDLYGNVIPEITLTQNNFSEFALNKPKTGWFMHNNFIYIVNNTLFSKGILNALFNDPEEIYNLNCPNNTTQQCTDFMEEEFPIDSDLIEPMYVTALNILSKSYSFPIDIENNSKDVDTVNARQ